MGLNGKPYRSGGGGPFSRGGGGGGGGGGRNGGGRDNNNNNNNNDNSRKAGRGDRGPGRDNNRGGGRDDNNRGGGGGRNHNNNNNGGGNGPRQTAGADVVGTLLGFMFQRYADIVYDSSTGILNLATFRESPDLANAKAAIDFNSVAFCKSLVNVIKGSSIGIPRYINLSGNSISSPNNFLRALTDEGMAGGILGIALDKNNIKDVSFVGALSRFTNLTELSLEDNPIADLHYRRVLERRIPTLTVLNHQPIKRPPLGLPYPKHTAGTFSPDKEKVLQFLEASLFRALEANNLQVLMTTYHPDAIFSCSADERYSVSTQLKHGADRSVREDLSKLNISIKENDTNLMSRGAVNRVVKGCAQVLASLEKGLYNKRFLTHHTLVGDANVTFLNGPPVTAIPIAVVSLHGKMMWLPRAAQQEDPRAALFDRTITLISANNGWQITTDTVYLRRVFSDHPLFFADNAARVERLCKAFGSIYPPEIFAALVSISASDKEYYELRDGIPKEAIEQCYLATNSDANKCVRAAKVCVMKGCSPQEAVAALDAVGWDLGRL